MCMPCLRKKIAAWLALAAISLNAFWPLLANAGPSDPDLASAICSATGLRHEAPLPGGADTRPSHCALCPLGAWHGAAIPVATAEVPLPVIFIEKVSARGVGLRSDSVLHPAAPPRAPPFSL